MYARSMPVEQGRVNTHTYEKKNALHFFGVVSYKLFLDLLRTIFLPHLFPRDFLTRVRGQWALPKSFRQLRGCKVSADEAGRGGKYVFWCHKCYFWTFYAQFFSRESTNL
jgi:hypothetical protein